MLQHIPKWILWIPLVFMAIWLFFYLINRQNEYQLVANILNISSVPDSLSVSECESWGWTDVLTTCAIHIHPSEFPMLITGYNFSELQMADSSHNVSSGPKLGSEFPVSTKYEVKPKEFVHGGWVKIFADENRANAIIDIYIE